MAGLSREWSVYFLIDIISELTEIPFLLMDAGGYPLYRSRYYFQADLSLDVAAELRRTLVSAGQSERKTSVIEVKSMEAVVAQVHGFSQKCYLVAGYFIAPSEEEGVLHHFGPELGRELLKKNLAGKWSGKQTLVIELVSGISRLFVKDFYIENVKWLIRALEAEAGLQSEKFWQGVFAALCYGFPFLWGAVVFPGFALVWQEDGTVRRIAPFSCALSEWVGSTGKPSQLPDLACDARGGNLLKLRPGTEALVSIPFSLGAGSMAVLHLAGEKPLHQANVQMLEDLGAQLAKKSYSMNDNVPPHAVLQRAYHSVTGLFIAGAPAQQIYPILLSEIANLLHCRSAALYTRSRNGEFIPSAFLHMDKAELKRDCLQLEQVYNQRNLYPRVPPGQQGGGYWEVPFYCDNLVAGVLILRGCPVGNNCENGFMQWVSGLLGFMAERQSLKSSLENVQKDILESLLLMLEAHSPWLRDHSKRTAVLARALAQIAGSSEEEMQQVYTAGILHNIGKIHLPPDLLQPPQTFPLSGSPVYARYVDYGADMLASISSLAYLSPVIAQLEENVNGSGYPAGRKEYEIHPHALMIRIASMFAALAAGHPQGFGTSTEILRYMEAHTGVQISSHYFTLFKQSIAFVDNKRVNLPSQANGSCFSGLTPREFEVLGHIARGKTNADIAETLFISEKTVKIHVSNILQKIGANDRTQAAVFYLTEKHHDN